MKTATLSAATAALSSFLLAPSSFCSDAPRPNIIFVLADDGGSHDFGFQDNPALAQLTPNLDQLRREGIRFTHAYANASMCAPSRAALLTGRYPHRFGFQQNYPEGDSELFKRTWGSDAWRSMGIDPSEKTVADHLKANGYATALIGKWHLGYDDAFHPGTRGFDHFWGLRGGSRAYFSAPELETAPPPKKYDRIEAGRAFVPEKQLTYITDDLTAAALRFISEKRDQPFYVFLSYTAPHTPLTARPDDVEWVEKNLPPADMKRVQNLALVRGLDRGMGELRAGLETLGLSQNTIIIFAVDNGGSIRGLADNAPHRGHKFSPFEGGLRVPLIAFWPGVTKPGADSDAPVMLFDFAPTFVEIAGGKTARGAKPFDALSLVPLLKREAASLAPRDLFWREINSQGPTKTMRRDNYKLIQYENRAPELYDVVADPGEKSNLAPRQPALVAQLSSAYAQWDSQMPEPRWYQEDPKPQPAAAAAVPPLAGAARAAMRKATEFMLSISTEGGYLFKYSPDLETRAGEQMAADFQIWMQPPGTPTMGETFLKAYAATKDPFYLEAARRAATALVRCQLESGGWHYSGSFNPKFPNKDGARSHQGELMRGGKHPDNPHYFVATTYDDNTTQSVITFLMKFTEAAGESKDPRDVAAKVSLERALAGMLRAQYPNGAWPQRYKGAPRKAADYPVVAASYPEKPAGKWPDADYTIYYTFNDNAQRDCIFVMFEAWKRYKKPEYLEAAQKGSDFILLAQMPAPQRGWAQQYDFDMNPVWARSFEPPAISSMESRSAMSALLEIHLKTGDEKYMKAVDEGVAWLKRSAIGKDLWSRFYELKTNKSIYCDNNARIYYDNKNARPGYNWQSAYKIPEFLDDYEKLKAVGRDAFLAEKNKPPAGPPADMSAKARAVISKLDAQGRWITKDRFLKRSEPADMITTEAYMANMSVLINYLEACAPDTSNGSVRLDQSGKSTKPAHRRKQQS